MSELLEKLIKIASTRRRSKDSLSLGIATRKIIEVFKHIEIKSENLIEIYEELQKETNPKMNLVYIEYGYVYIKVDQPGYKPTKYDNFANKIYDNIGQITLELFIDYLGTDKIKTVNLVHPITDIMEKYSVNKEDVLRLVEELKNCHPIEIKDDVIKIEISPIN